MGRRLSNAGIAIPAAVATEKKWSLPSLFLAGVNEFRKDGSLSLYVMLLQYTVLIILTALMCNKVGESDHRISHHLYTYQGRFVDYYKASILFSLSISLPAMVDILMMVIFLQKDIRQKGIPVIEFIRRFITAILAFPNVLIYFQVLPSNVVDMVLFLQFLGMYYVLMYRLYTLSSAQKVVPFNQLRDIFYSNNCAAGMGFLYKLSSHDVILGKEAFKALFTACIVLSLGFAVRKITIWFQLNSRISEVFDKHAKRSTRLSFTGLMVAMSFNIILALMHLIYYRQEYVFFPNTYKSYMAISWLHCFVSMVYNAFRNFELIKSDFATMDRLDSNRKMTRSISHEIRTPLNTAFLALELLIGTLRAPFKAEKHEELRAELLEIAESIREGCDISLGILNQLLTFEKLSAGMMQLESNAICIERLLDSNMKLFKMQAQQIGVIFKLDCGNVDMLKYLVHVDEHKMNQVLRNLLSNAMKFTPKGGVVEIKLVHMVEDTREATLLEQKLEEDISTRNGKRGSRSIEKSILGRESLSLKAWFGSGSKDNNHKNKYETETSVSLNDHHNLQNNQKKARLLPSIAKAPVHTSVRQVKTHGTILISVVDSGPGVSRDDQKKLFNEYVQINPGELQKGQGTGLGLSISKAIVHLHGGNIGMNSEGRGKGSTFFIELPCYIDQNTNIRGDSKGKIFPNLSSAPGSSPLKSNSDDHSEAKGNVPAIELDENKQVDLEAGCGQVIPLEVKREEGNDSLQTSSQTVDLIAPSSKSTDIGSATAPSPTQNSSTTIIGSPSKYKGVGRPTSFICAPQIFKILVVDDSAPNRKMLSRLLTREGHRVFEGDDGSVGVELIRASLAAKKAEDKKETTVANADSATEVTNETEGFVVYDFVLMDYYMNHMNGPEAVKLIREAGYDGPVIGVTGVMGDESTEFINRGADVVLCKPVTVQSIWKALKSIGFM